MLPALSYTTPDPVMWLCVSNEYDGCGPCPAVTICCQRLPYSSYVQDNPPQPLGQLAEQVAEVNLPKKYGSETNVQLPICESVTEFTLPALLYPREKLYKLPAEKEVRRPMLL